MVCARWKSFESFLQDMGECPEGMSLDREDVNKSYAPDNCRWATALEQNRNKRNNRVLSAQGVTKCLAEWAVDTGIKRGTIVNRLRLGWSIERALGAQAT